MKVTVSTQVTFLVRCDGHAAEGDSLTRALTKARALCPAHYQLALQLGEAQWERVIKKRPAQMELVVGLSGAVTARGVVATLVEGVPEAQFWIRCRGPRHDSYSGSV